MENQIQDNEVDRREEHKNQEPTQQYENKGRFAYNQMDSQQSNTER